MKNKNSLRILALVLCLAFLVVGCGRGNTSSSEPVESSESSASEPVEEFEARDKIFLADKIDKGIERNADTVGWLYLPEMDIDDAILQRNDPSKSHYENNNYYLRIDEDKKYSIFGCLWADPDSIAGSRDELSKNTIIYGHSDYKDDGKGPEFSKLFMYNDIDFLKENPYIYFSTQDGDFVYEIFSVFYTHVNFNYIQANPSDAQFQQILDTAIARSEFIFDNPVTTKDKIITLSTCTGLYNKADKDNYRYVIMGRLLPNNEVPVGPVKVSKNPNPQKS